MTLPICGSFAAASAFLVGNGRSFLELDAEALAAPWSMTLNNGPATFRPNANCTVDEPGRFSFSTWRDPRITKFMPMAHFVREGRGVKAYY